MGLVHVHYAFVEDEQECSCGRTGKWLRVRGLFGKEQTDSEDEIGDGSDEGV